MGASRLKKKRKKQEFERERRGSNGELNEEKCSRRLFVLLCVSEYASVCVCVYACEWRFFTGA